MMRSSLSYRCPVAKEKMLITSVSAVSFFWPVLSVLEKKEM
jgi:hypothetical protein